MSKHKVCAGCGLPYDLDTPYAFDTCRTGGRCNAESTPQNTSNSGSELEQILRDYARYNREVHQGEAVLHGKTISEAIAAIDRLYIKRYDVVEAVGPRDTTKCTLFKCPQNNHCKENVAESQNQLRQEILAKLGLSGEQEGE